MDTIHAVIGALVGQTTPLDIPDEQLYKCGTGPRALVIRQTVRILTGGNHHPLLCWCHDSSDGSLGLWVVKPQRLESFGNRRGTLDVLAELAAAEACGWVGVSTPSIGLVRFPKNADPCLYSDVADEERAEVAQLFLLNRGLFAFCSRYLLQAIDLLPEMFRYRSAAGIIEGAGASLFALDAYIRHDDREVENPNALWWRDSLIAIDNGSAFAGLDKPGMQGKWLAGQTVLHSKRLRNHVLYEPLARQAAQVNWEAVATRLTIVTDVAIDEMASHWPSELDNDPLTSRAHLKKNLVEFLKERRSVARDVIEAAANLFRSAA